MNLVTLDQAKLQLRIPPTQTEHDDDIELKIAQASALVVDYIKRPDHGWEPGSPGSPGGGSPQDDLAFTIAQAAVLEVLTNLWVNRGDADVVGPITPRVEAMLHRLKEWSLA